MRNAKFMVNCNLRNIRFSCIMEIRLMYTLRSMVMDLCYQIARAHAITMIYCMKIAFSPFPQTLFKNRQQNKILHSETIRLRMSYKLESEPYFFGVEI